MERTHVAFAVIFVFLLLLASEGGGIMGKETQGIWRHPCMVPSKRFKGPCISDHNCANTCRSEGHNKGECEGVRRRCLCSAGC